MNKERYSLGDFFKIHPIKTQLKIANKDGIDNFREFQRIYGPLFNNNIKQNSKPLNSKSIVETRPKIEIKTIQLEMPRFGSESAVLNPKKNQPKPKKPPTKILKTKSAKKIETKEQGVSTTAHGLVKKLSEMEHSLRKDPKVEIHQTTSTILDITNRELEVANEQLEQIKKLIESKQVQTQTIKSQPYQTTHKVKYSRHRSCHQKKYLTALQSMQKKLHEMEKKYLKKPQVTYKSVNDTFTQFSKSVEMFRRKSLPEEEEIDQTLKVAISELEDIVNTDISKKFEKYTKENNKEDIESSPFDSERNAIKTPQVTSVDSVEKYFNQIQEELLLKKSERTTVSPFCQSSEYSRPIEDFLAGKDLDETSSKSSISPREEQPKRVTFENVLTKDCSGDHQKQSIKPLKYSFKKQNSDQSFEKNDLTDVIEVSEKHLNRYRNLKQDVIDVNDFCNTLHDIVTTDDEDDDKTTEISKDEQNIFEETKLQESVMKSCYLMKEFNVKPKIFREETPKFCDKNKFYKMAKRCSASGDRNMDNMIENLQNALENSIFTVDKKNIIEMCESNVLK
ncbi:uncharacterized protein LOC130448436 [Diorhabda sublineata]|uniref:uncharacterized protein LOC130448436 n=1 Tax=Diorhabda sublineata TaxID=1163346 RepID=UPI0024E07E28|nr:uncharacterized protein LOC130448436 [Diorhabda sublineata]